MSTSSQPKAGSSRFQGISNLSALPSIAEDTILATLRERYLDSEPYTSISSSALVSVNPHTYLPINGDSSLQNYVSEYYQSAVDDATSRDASPVVKEKLGPHIFRLALSSYYDMRRTGQDQILVMSGAMGSGKTEMRRLVIKAIAEVAIAAPGKKGAKLGTQIANAQYILESFGNAHTLTNDNASRFGNYTEMQFNERGRLAGLKAIEYYFERSRVSQTPAVGERNFHIFYYLVSGVQGEERTFLKLGNISDYRYLQCRVRRQGVEDQQRFEQLKQAFKQVGLSQRLVAQVCQLLATILHIGNLHFTSDDKSHEGAIVVNYEVLTTVAEFLGVSEEALSELFSFKTMLMRKEVCTTFLDAEQAEGVRDELARTLYSLLFSWLNEHINQKLCKDSFSSYIAILDLPGHQNAAGQMGGSVNSVDQFCFNFANEKVHNWALRRIHETSLEEAAKEKLPVTRLPYFDNSECLRMMSDSKGGLIHIMDNESRKKRSESSMLEAMGKRHAGHASFSVQADRGAGAFTINHYGGSVSYSAENFLERNANETSSDILRLLKGSMSGTMAGAENQGSNNPFIKSLFSSKTLTTQAHPRNDDTIVAVQQPVRPMRAPSTRRKKNPRLPALDEEGAGQYDGDEVGGGNETAAGGHELQCVAGQHWQALNLLLSSFDQAQPWFVFCLRPNDSQLPAQVEIRSMKAQIRALGLSEMAQKLQTSYEVRMTHAEACERYGDELQVRGILEGPSHVDRLKDLKRVLGYGDADIAIGANRAFLSHQVFHRFEDRLRAAEADEQRRPREEVEMLEGRMPDPFTPYRAVSPSSPAFEKDPYDRDDSQIALPLVPNAQPLRHHDNFSVDDFDERREFAPSQISDKYGDAASNGGTETYAPSRNMFRDFDTKEKDVLDVAPHDGEVTEEYKETAARRRWVALCWMLTFWVPSPLLSWWGGMKRQDVRQAWREKLAINLIIWFICGCTIFVIAILGPLICPTQHVYNSSELASKSYTNDPNNALVAVRGEVFDLVALAKTHLTAVPVIPVRSIMQYGGLDATNIFPVQVSALCAGTRGSLSPYVTLDTTNTSDPYTKYHDFRSYTNDPRPDWYAEQMTVMRSRFRKGFMGFSKKDVRNMAGAGRAVGIYRDKVYELTTYIAQNGGGLRAPDGVQLTADDTRDRQFMSSQVVSVFTYNSGQDVTQLFDNLASDIGQDVVNWQRDCLRNLFIIGEVDTRDSPQCQFSTYILLALSIVMVAIIGFKFLAALHFGSSRAPENHDKFIICQVPCYTEGEESLRRTIDSVVKTKYDDKRKLLLIVCDGNIKGFGNEKATPAIVLDILGVDPNADPEPLSFQSLGEGAKQHNMGKIYAGLYECSGHVVPYLVVVKVGKPTERPKPGNRGKRDSQMVIMHFLNKASLQTQKGNKADFQIHFNAPMNPLELEMYHQIKNVIGVNPSFYEYLFMVDADTTVEELSLNRLVSAMMHDKKIIGVCGETSLANSKQSIVTMSQVYEYFISHHLAKAFESLFGSITCLPGCFSMYRLRTPDTHKPLFISNQIIHEYSENRVDTLHLKNLLHLGEDRYLTTLVLKHFPTYKTKFVRDAYAQTVAPDSASVLLSQRRRWINSTVHNLAELVSLDQLCGFCCFSMRFVVFIDLLSTIIAPVTVAYIGYLLYIIIGKGGTIPILSIVMLAAIYGLQALIFIFRMRWDMIAWMIFYILAIPVFSFFLPLYSFWKMDDFSWGTTRLVVGEKGKKTVIHDEGKFDPRSIPLKSWNEYENELWDNESNHSGSYLPPMKAEYDTRSAAASAYGGEYGRPGSVMTAQGPGNGYNPRGLTPMASYQDLHAQAQSRAPSFYAPPQAPYNGMSMGDPTMSPFGSNPNLHHATMYDRGSLYQAQSGPPSAYNSFYGQPNPGHQLDHRASSYSLQQQAQAQGQRPPSQHLMSNQNSRPATQLLPEQDWAPLDLGEAGISDAQLESSIRRICAEADLDNLTKKGVRKQLEQEYGVGLDQRKETINRIIERVLNE